MTTYLALLRGVNVGGKSIIKMAELREVLTAAGLDGVRTYIQSGNVIFASGLSAARAAFLIKSTIQSRFGIEADVAVFTSKEWDLVIDAAPEWWGRDQDWKHNLLILTERRAVPAVIASMGELRKGIEAVQPGKGVIYQSISWKDFSRSTSSKLVANPLYKKMTIRNFNTARKLRELLAGS